MRSENSWLFDPLIREWSVKKKQNKKNAEFTLRTSWACGTCKYAEIKPPKSGFLEHVHRAVETCLVLQHRVLVST